MFSLICILVTIKFVLGESPRSDERHDSDSLADSSSDSVALNLVAPPNYRYTSDYIADNLIV